MVKILIKIIAFLTEFRLFKNQNKILNKIYKSKKKVRKKLNIKEGNRVNIFFKN